MKKALNRASFLLLLALGSFSLTLLFMDSFKLQCTRGFYIWAAVICLFAWLCHNIRHMAFPCTLICAAGLFFACRRAQDAFLIQINDLADKISGQYLDHFLYSAQIYDFSDLTDEHSLVLLIIYTFICLLLASALSAESGRVFCSLFIAAAVFFLCICVNGYPPVYVVVAFLLFCSLLLVSGGAYSPSSGGGSTVFILTLPALLLLCLLLSFSPPSEYDLSDTDIEMAQKLDALGQRITKIFNSDYNYEAPESPEPTTETDSPLTELLDNLTSTAWSMGDGALDLSKGYLDFDRTQLMLRVRAEQSGYMYLRCFSYGNYLGTGWSTATSFGDGAPLSFTGLSLKNANGAETLKADIQLVATGKTVRPLPYYSLEYSGNDIYVASTGESEYSAEYISYSGDVLLQRIPTEYSSAEAEYRAYVYENYLALPEAARSSMLEIAAEAGISAESADVIGRVAAFIQSSAEYDLSVTGFDSDDYAVYFLREAKRGYCTHFATAAAVMYRALGIPARVVDGFAVSAKAGEYVNVYRSDEHAWVEVYIDGLGWLPVEVTGSAVSSNAPQETQQPQPETGDEQPVTPALPERAELQPDIVPVGIISSDVTQNSAGLSGGAKKAIVIVIIILAATGCIVLWQIVFLRDRKRRFMQRDGNRAVIYIYRCARTLSRFGADIPSEITGITEKARFSQHKISREERIAAYALFIDMRDRLCGGKSIVTRFIIKYILCFR